VGIHDNGDGYYGSDYDQAIQLFPNFALVYSHRGRARSDSGDKKGAISDYDQTIRLDPNYAGDYMERSYARLSISPASNRCSMVSLDTSQTPPEENYLIVILTI
jgi:tetratricopeptide (TPR) repeat protein